MPEFPGSAALASIQLAVDDEEVLLSIRCKYRGLSFAISETQLDTVIEDGNAEAKN